MTYWRGNTVSVLVAIVAVVVAEAASWDIIPLHIPPQFCHWFCAEQFRLALFCVKENYY
jgi:hypothetical protein